MRLSPIAQIDWLGRVAVPGLITMIFVLLGMVPLPLPFFHSLGPGLALAAVYHWSIHTPYLLRAPMAFAIGLLGDLLGAAPLGVGALVMLLAQVVVESQRRLLVGGSFLMVWWGYMVVAATAGSVSWLLVSLTSGSLMDPTATVFAYLWSLCVYPGIAALLGLAQRILPREDEE
jgi:rod shape-determining protein MreD